MIFDVIVLGAGISGLTSAYKAKTSGKIVKVLEASPRPGGMIRSEKKEGFVLEFGPNTILSTPELVDLIHKLNLENDMLWASTKMPRFVQFQRQLIKVPLSPPAFLTTALLSTAGRLRALGEVFVPRRKKETNDESLAAFMSRRFGAEVVERLVAPFVSGIWAGDVDKLSAEASFPALVQMEQGKGSVTRGMFTSKNGKKTRWGLISFNDGLSTLIDGLVAALPESIELSTVPKSLGFSNGIWTIKTERGSYDSKSLVMAMPAWAAAPLITDLSKETAQALLSIRYAPLVVFHLAVHHSDLERQLNGFGYLVAPAERSDILGCLWSSSIFPNRAPRDRGLLTVFMGGASRPDLMELQDQELLKRTMTALQPILGFNKHPEVLALTRIEKAIPQYNLGHLDIVKQLKKAEQEFEGLRFGGNYWGGISVGDVIKAAPQN